MFPHLSPSELKATADPTDAAEEPVRRAQKMEALGRVAIGVAHDFNNLLTVINGYAELVAEDLEGAPARELVLRIRSAGERGAALTRQLLTFAHTGARGDGATDVNAVLLGLAPVLTRLIGRGSTVAVAPGPDLWPVAVDPAGVEQVLLNLVSNARDAMPDGGRVSIETTNVGPGDPAGPGDQGHVLLTVADTGTGMTREVLERSGEPFFTTKDPVPWPGLGLGTVFGVVRAAGGRVEISRAPGQGSVFRVYLPRAGSAPRS
ncbi:Blue-light-activated protein [Gemmata sp. SH-PL17]|uniref:sensor histidine kinase n=1 Tax=Gemmata sp. SH-PL17 TaxID=1630693 RepID=UPI00078EA56C|nr:ATP-binding protein [Gemmata sp. SH-PL17]AMV24049.1 Blue-light-activated protein [Gemmata sp. SH-PL17]